MRFLPGRFLKHNKTTEGPSNLIFFDTETKSTPHHDQPRRRILTLKVGVAHYVRLEKGEPTREDKCVFTDHRVFWDWLRGKLTTERPTWAFAHNIAFDLTVCRFWEDVENDLWRFYEKESEQTESSQGGNGKAWRGCFIPEDPPTIIKVRASGTKRICWFVDSLNYYRVPLKDLAETHGLSKNYTLLDWAPMEECIAYCDNDVEILKRSMLSLMRFVRDNDLGVWKATIAGQALAAYRHRFMRHSILPHNDPAARRHERSCYYGGEVGVYFVGRVVPDLQREPLQPVRHSLPRQLLLQGPIYHLDVNSLYPAVMRDNDFPTQLVDIREQSTVKDVLALPRGVGASALVRLDARSRPYPIKHRGQLWFGLGHMETCLCGPELLAACRSGDVERLSQVHVYTTQPIFRAYVQELYALRLAFRSRSDPVGEGIVKNLLNALYGKFGQKGSAMTPIPNYPSPFGWGMHYERIVKRGREGGDYCGSRNADSPGDDIYSVKGREIRIVGWNAFEVSKDSEPDKSFPAIAAWVTSFGRERMRHLRSLCGPVSVLYQDTDSLHVTEQGLRRLMRAGELHPTALGKLKLVGVADEAEYRGIKSYTFDGVRTEAGLKMGAMPLDSGGFREEHFQRLRDTISAEPPAGIVITTVAKANAQHDVRGVAGVDGFVRPVNKVWVNGEVE